MARSRKTLSQWLLSRRAQRWVGTGLGTVFGITVAMLTAQPIHQRPPLLGRVMALLPGVALGITADLKMEDGQLMSLPPEEQSVDATPQARTCPVDMVEVASAYCPAVEHFCVEYISASRDRCAKYRESSRCVGDPVAKNFCIDRYEYPNREGVRPTIGVTWNDAQRLCAAEGKRLCSDSEWTLACEGNERLPYPYGYERDSTVCNIDRPYIVPDDDAFRDPARRAQEIKRLDQSEPSGMRPNCVSAFGVYDMAGNVDEWVVNERGSLTSAPYISGLKGGYWGPVRNRCRPMTVDHNQWHTGYQIGFRCCEDARRTQPDGEVSATETQAVAAVPTSPPPAPPLAAADSDATDS